MFGRFSSLKMYLLTTERRIGLTFLFGEYNGESGSHIPPTSLGHRYGICEHLSPNYNLSQALTAGGCRRRKYFM